MKEQYQQIRWHYLIYKITNIDNGMIYIGQHRTTNPNDSYMGSGAQLNRDYAKYIKAGKKIEEHFKKEILFDFDNFNEMNNKERELVNESFVADSKTYNRILGGSCAGNYHNGRIVIEYNGQTHSIAEWEAILGISRFVIRHRYNKGMTMQQIIDIPPRERDKVWFKSTGEGHTIYEWVKISGLDYDTLRRRLSDMKMPVDEAVTKPKTEPQRFAYKGRMLTLKQLTKISGLKRLIIETRIKQYKWPIEKAVDTPLMPNPVSIWEQKFEWRGGSYTIKELAEMSDGKVFKQTIHDRIKDGWDIDKIMSTPSKAVDHSWRKKKYVYHDEMLTLDEVAERTGISKNVIQTRMLKGMSFEKAISMPMLKHRNQLFKLNNESHTLNEWSVIKHIPSSVIRNRMSKGMSFEEAITKPYYPGKGAFRHFKSEMRRS